MLDFHPVEPKVSFCTNLTVSLHAPRYVCHYTFPLDVVKFALTTAPGIAFALTVDYFKLLSLSQFYLQLAAGSLALIGFFLNTLERGCAPQQKNKIPSYAPSPAQKVRSLRISIAEEDQQEGIPTQFNSVPRKTACLTFTRYSLYFFSEIAIPGVAGFYAATVNLYFSMVVAPLLSTALWRLHRLRQNKRIPILERDLSEDAARMGTDSEEPPHTLTDNNILSPRAGGPDGTGVPFLPGSGKGHHRRSQSSISASTIMTPEP